MWVVSSILSALQDRIPTMAITKKDVEHVARLARLALSEEEKDRYTGQLASILTYIEKMSALNTDHVIPTTHVSFLYQTSGGRTKWKRARRRRWGLPTIF